MKIEEPIRIVYSFIFPAGANEKRFYPSIKDNDITSLIIKLQSRGIHIVEGLCEKVISYESGRDKRKASIPLGSDLNNPHADIVRYMLRTLSLDICIRDIHESKNIENNRVLYEDGIIGMITSVKPSHRDEELIIPIKSVITEFYDYSKTTLFQL